MRFKLASTLVDVLGMARRAVSIVLLAAAVIAACSSSKADGPGVTGGVSSNVDVEMPVPAEAVADATNMGAYRVAQPPEQVFHYYQTALPANGWGIEKDSSRLDAAPYIFTVCRHNKWETVGVNADAHVAGGTLLTVGALPPQPDGCR